MNLLTVFQGVRKFRYGLLILALGWAVVSPAQSQIPQQVTSPSTGQVGPPAPGPGVIRARVIAAEPGQTIDNLPLVLYALQPDGSPGLANAETNLSGEYVFTNLNNSPDVIYLLGTRIAEVPFGKRVVFQPGETEIDAAIQLQTVHAKRSALEISETRWLLDWIGDQLLVQVSQKITNRSDAVIFIQETDRDGQSPFFEARLPDEIAEFLGASEGLLRREGEESTFIDAWGPFYPGDQELRYGFLAKKSPGSDQVDVEQLVPSGAPVASVLIPTRLPTPGNEEWIDTGEILEIGDQNYRRFKIPAVQPGGIQKFSLTAPPSSADDSQLQVSRSDFWVDHDDTEVRVNAEITVEVDTDVRLLAAPGESLLHIALPPGAEFQGLAGSTGAFGVVPGEEGGLDVRGPLPPGTSTLGYRFRLPVRGEARLDLSLSKEVDLLNVLVADNGVVIDSDRLHRQRPFKQGTRFYLHRQAYQVNPGETISLTLTPIGSRGVSTNGARIAALLAGVLAAFFLATPLRTQRKEPLEDEAIGSLARERADIYESINDLEDDFQTGKVDESEYQSLRQELYASAVKLLQEEEALKNQKTDTTPTQNLESGTQKFCVECGQSLQPQWKFCAGCGSGVSSSETE
ncbi:MAG: hypothetical protein CL917_08395 [Deltaproteobacteria bacterium]|nr:hypothetical protein [Deltaproteobacteria bacterium]